MKKKNKTAVVIKGNPFYIDDDVNAFMFYSSLGDYLGKIGYDVVRFFDAGTAVGFLPEADIYIGHSMGTESLSGLSKKDRKIKLGIKDGLYHPDDNCIGKVGRPKKDFRPNKFHYILTDEMKEAIVTIECGEEK
jgi:hypothetical protein